MYMNLKISLHISAVKPESDTVHLHAPIGIKIEWGGIRLQVVYMHC